MLFHIIYCPWFAFSLFSGSFKPIYLLKAHLFISWACDPLFLPLGLNGFSIYLPNSFCPCCWASSSHLGFQNGPQHSQIQNQRFTNTKYLMRIAHKPKRESQAIPKVATYQERANHQTTEPSNNKPLSLFQIATHKYQITKPRESL